MGYWLLHATSVDADGADAASEWIVEADDASIARTMVAQALAAAGGALRSARAEPVDAPPAWASEVGISVPIRGRDAHAARTGLAFEEAPASAGEDAPRWADPDLWAALSDAPEGHATYAIVDSGSWATVHDDLRHDIADSGVPSACLYDLGPDLDAVAPYLLDLSPLRSPCPDPPTPLHAMLLGRGRLPAPALFLQSTAALEDLRRDLRKLTKVRDTDDRWYFNRFWEPEFFLYFVCFLDGRRLLAPLAQVTRFAAVIEDATVSARTDLRAARHAPADREGDMDLLFDAGTAMVGIRHARALERRFGRGCDAEDVFFLAKEALSLEGMDYRFVARGIDIAYCMRAYYGPEAGGRLTADVVSRCFDEDGEVAIGMDILQGHCMFALIHGIAPDRLRNGIGL